VTAHLSQPLKAPINLSTSFVAAHPAGQAEAATHKARLATATYKSYFKRSLLAVSSSLRDIRGAENRWLEARW
jgi:hypothetical protein